MYELINNILIREDIEGLIANGAPADEYIDEAAQIAAALNLLPASQLTENVILATVSLVWAKSFELSEHDMKLRLSALARVVRTILTPSAT